MILITDDDAQKAAEYLRNTAEEAAQARAERHYVEEYRKTVKAQLMSRCPDKPLGVQEREAYAAQEYVTHLEAIKQAVFNDEKHRFMREAAQAKISAWQTMNKNLRSAV